MRWRDIRFEKPTKADADKDGMVLQLLSTGNVCRWYWTPLGSCVAWMPLSELPAFDPIPDPPEGWRFVEAGEAFDNRAKFWGLSNHWVETLQEDGYAKELVYIVPIDPPEPPKPQYRPFANAAEFEPYFGRMIKEKSLDDFRTVVTSFSDKGVWLAGGSIATGYREAFDIYEFANGFPFGVKVEP
jgi:hypothetical protein